MTSVECCGSENVLEKNSPVKEDHSFMPLNIFNFIEYNCTSKRHESILLDENSQNKEDNVHSILVFSETPSID